MEEIQAKSILSKVKNDSFFGLTYNMNLYRGCQHACIYCDSRSVCYQLGELSHIRYKGNAIELLKKELSKKKLKGTIGFGSMNDPYMPVESKMQLTRQALEVVSQHRFPVHIITKSNLVTRDIDLLSKISKVYAAISFTITTADDDLARIIEPNAPSPSSRFEALRLLSENNIYC
jgi:DNA repair photolyase